MNSGAKHIECMPEEEKCFNDSQILSVVAHVNYFNTMFVLDGFVGCKTLNFGEFVSGVFKG